MTAIAVVVLLAMAATGAEARQQAASEKPPPLTLSVDRYLSIDTGADLMFSSAITFSEFEHLAFVRLKRGPRTNIPLGIAKAVLLDHPLAVFLVVMQHEAFGHGGRAREFGATATYSVGWPWTANALFYGGTRFGGGASWGDAPTTPEETGRIFAGGTEANTRSATLIERELVAGTPLRTTALLYYLRSRWYASQYVLRTPNPATDPAGFFAEFQGGDVANYLGELNRKYYGDPGITPAGVSPTVQVEYDRLRRQAILNLATPGAWLALWAAGRDVGIGTEPKAIPAIRIGNRRVLPLINADWMVDGGAVSVEVIVSRRASDTASSRWFSLLMRNGNGPGGHFWNAGGTTERLAQWKSLAVGGEIEMWRQPSFGTGGGVNTWISVGDGALRGLRIYGGYKTDGDWPGRPANRGGFFRIGYRFDSR